MKPIFLTAAVSVVLTALAILIELLRREIHMVRPEIQAAVDAVNAAAARVISLPAGALDPDEVAALAQLKAVADGIAVPKAP